MKLTLDQAVRELRHRLGLTQQKLAFKMDLAVRTVSVYETGDTVGSFEVVRRFAELAETNGFADLASIFHDAMPSSWDLSRKLQETTRELLEAKAEIASLRHKLELQDSEFAEPSSRRPWQQGLVHPV